MRLWGGDSSSLGYVQMLYGGIWESICAGSEIEKQEAGVVCRELGFTQGSHINDTYLLNEGTTGFRLSSVDCQGSETSLRNCNLGTWMQQSCEDLDLLAVLCSNTSKQGMHSCQSYHLCFLLKMY